MRVNKKKKFLISGNNIGLRYLNLKDISHTYLEMINDMETVKFLDNPIKRSKNDLIKYFNNIKKRKDLHFFAVIEINTNKYIGNAKIGPIDLLHKRTGFGRLIHKNFHNFGYGSEVSKLLIKFIFEKLKLNRIIEHNITDNVRSYKSNLKAGLDSEGIIEKYVYNRGRYRDVYMVGLTRQRYELKKKKGIFLT